MARQSKSPEVLAALATPGTQADIAERTGLKQCTASYILRKMEAHREVCVDRKGWPYVYTLAPTAEAPVVVAADDAVDDDDTEATALDLQKSRAWLKDWRPSRDPMVAAMFGPRATATDKTRAHGEQ